MVGIGKSRIHIWQYVSSLFTLLGVWNADVDTKDGWGVENADHYVMLGRHMLPHIAKGPPRVHYFNGLKGPTIPYSENSHWPAAMNENYLVTTGGMATVQIRNARKWDTLMELDGHEYGIFSLDACDGVIASRDVARNVIIWNIKAAIEGRPAQLASFEDPNFHLHYVQSNSKKLKLGRYFLAFINSMEDNNIGETDFPV